MKTALVVDDSKVARFGLIKILKRRGLEVATAISGEQALEYLQTNTPDVIFMDFFMPGMDGPDATRAIRANEKTASIPVIMCTSKESLEDQKSAMNAGVDGFMTKPATPERLDQIIEELQTFKGEAAGETGSHGAENQNNFEVESGTMEPSNDPLQIAGSSGDEPAQTADRSEHLEALCNQLYPRLKQALDESLPDLLAVHQLAMEQAIRQTALDVAEQISTNIAKNVAHETAQETAQETAEEIAATAAKESSMAAVRQLEELLDEQWEQKLVSFIQNPDFLAAVEAKSAETADVIATEVAQHMLNDQLKAYSNREFQWLQQDMADLVESRMEHAHRTQTSFNIFFIIAISVLFILFLFR